MPSLFDMISNAQNGQGMDQLARQFGLSPQQTQSAVEALLPAFSQGLQRNASDPNGLAGLLTALAGGGHEKYYDDAKHAVSADGVADGNNILGHLFGSKDVSRAVTAQAAQETGIGQGVLKQMLPAVASMVMGSLFKQSSGQMGASSGGGLSDLLGAVLGGGQGGGMFGGQPQAAGGANPLGDILGQLMGGGASAKPQASGGANPLGDILGQLMGGGAGAQQQQASAGSNPLGDILGQLMGGGQQAPATRGGTPAPAQGGNPLGDLLGQMFDSGGNTRSDYQKGMSDIFDQFTKGMDR